MRLSPALTRTARLTLASCAVLLLTQCAGYRLGSDKPGRLKQVNTLAIPVFKNKTLEPRSSVIITNAVNGAFQTDGTYKIVDSSKADAILRGTIRRFERRQLRSSRINTLRTRELELRLIVEYAVEDRNGAVLVKGTADGATNVFLDPNFQLTERQAIEDAAQRCAQEIASQVCNGWGGAELPADETSAPEASMPVVPARKAEAPAAPAELTLPEPMSPEQSLPAPIDATLPEPVLPESLPISE